MSTTVPVLALALLALGSLSAGQWMRGGALVIAADPAVRIGATGAGGPPAPLGDDLPRIIPGLFHLEASDEGGAVVETSNGVRLRWAGPGYFAVERLEQFLDEGETAPAAGRTDAGSSRMILNLREGRLALGVRPLSDASRVILETPVGRISLHEARLLVRIDFDEGSRFYNFSIECADGSALFSDRRGEDYRVRAGQRLSGAGASNSPAIDISAMSEEGDEFFDEHPLKIDTTTDGDWKRFASVMVPIDRGTVDAAPKNPPNNHAESVRRRFIIEYAPPAHPVTPYRGRVKPPSAYQSDLF